MKIPLWHSIARLFLPTSFSVYGAVADLCEECDGMMCSDKVLGITQQTNSLVSQPTFYAPLSKILDSSSLQMIPMSPRDAMVMQVVAERLDSWRHENWSWIGIYDQLITIQESWVLKSELTLHQEMGLLRGSEFRTVSTNLPGT